MKTSTRKTEAQRTVRIVVKRADSSGRILYDVASILSSDAAKRHFEALERMDAAGAFDKKETATATDD